MKHWFRLLLCSALLVIGLPLFVHAQTVPTMAVSHIVVSPQYPDPGQTVTLSLSDYSVDTSGAKISWFVNGKELLSAKNQRSAQVTAGALGTSQTIVTQTKLTNGNTLTAQATVQPVRVDLLVEADTLTPSFYTGRAMPSSGSTVRVTAIPFVSTTPKDPATYSYRWTVGDTVVNGGSQYGQNSVMFASGFERSMYVSVTVIDGTGNIVATKAVEVPITQAELHFYTVNPLSGESPIAMQKGFTFVGDELKVRAEPYFVSRTLMQQNPFVEWKLNNRTIQNPDADLQNITLRKQGEHGSFNLEFQIRNLQNLLQGINGAITLNF